MKILHINCNYITTTLHQLMINKLEKLGYKNEVFCPTYNRDLAIIKLNKKEHVCECFRKWDRLFFDYKQEKIFKCVQQRISVKDFDCIHAYTLYTDGNCAMRLSKKYGVPYVVAVRDTDVNTFLKYRPYLRHRAIRIMQGASAIFFLSETYRDTVFGRYVPKEYYDELYEKTYIVPNGIDDFWLVHSPESNKTLDGNVINLVYAGRISKRKNIPTTQAAMRILQKEGYQVKLTIVGKVDDESEFDRVIHDSDTEYIKPQPKEKLADIYRKHDIFVMPSFTETFGLVYAEALSQGLPVVYSKGQGFDKQFPEGYVGFHVDSRSPQSVAVGIRKVIENYSEINKNCCMAARKFSWDELVNTYSEIYERIHTVG